MIGGKENPFDPCGFCNVNGLVEYEPGTKKVASCPFTEALDSVATREDLDPFDKHRIISTFREKYLSGDPYAEKFREALRDEQPLDNCSECPKINYDPFYPERLGKNF